MSFNIGSQTGGVINNVVGNQQIYASQRGEAISINTVRQAVQRLRSAIDDTALDSRTAAAISASLGQIESEVQAKEPDRSRAKEALEKVTDLLTSVGAIAASGQALLGPIQSVALWIGSWGPAVARLFPTLG